MHMSSVYLCKIALTRYMPGNSRAERSRNVYVLKRYKHFPSVLKIFYILEVKIKFYFGTIYAKIVLY